MTTRSHSRAELSENLKLQEKAALPNATDADKEAAETSANKLDLKTGVKSAKDALWAGTTGLDENLSENYKGEYVASNSYIDNGLDKSWANLDPDKLIAIKNVQKLEINDAVKLAEQFDADVNGRANDGSSSCKEGAESFVFGANYSGTRGVNISEVSGLSASYVRGKRVSWLDGDAWSYQKGGDSYSESYLEDMDTQVTAGNIDSKTDSRGHVRTKVMAQHDNTSVRMAGGNVNTVNMGGTSNEFILFGACVNSYIGPVKATLNVGVSFNTCNIVIRAADASLYYTKLSREHTVRESVSNKKALCHISIISGSEFKYGHEKTSESKISTSINKARIEKAAKKIEKTNSKMEKNYLVAHENEQEVDTVTARMANYICTSTKAGTNANTTGTQISRLGSSYEQGSSAVAVFGSMVTL